MNLVFNIKCKNIKSIFMTSNNGPNNENLFEIEIFWIMLHAPIWLIRKTIIKDFFTFLDETADFFKRNRTIAFE